MDEDSSDEEEDKYNGDEVIKANNSTSRAQRAA